MPSYNALTLFFSLFYRGMKKFVQHISDPVGPDQTDRTKPATVTYSRQTGPTGGNTQPVDDPAYGGGLTYQVGEMQDYK